MSHFIDLRLEPALWLGADWSLRWALLIAVVAAGFAFRTPRSAAVRMAVCQLALVAGLALPLVPHWWKGQFLPARSSSDLTKTAFRLAPVDARGESAHGSDARSVVATSATSPPHAASLPSLGQEADVALSRELPLRPLVRTAESLGLWRMTVLLAAGLWARRLRSAPSSDCRFDLAQVPLPRNELAESWLARTFRLLPAGAATAAERAIGNSPERFRAARGRWLAVDRAGAGRLGRA